MSELAKRLRHEAAYCGNSDLGNLLREAAAALSGAGRKDSERLDWLELRQVRWRNTISAVYPWVGFDAGTTVRDAIDAALSQGGKP